MAKISTLISDDLDAFFDTTGAAVTATYNGASFGVQFFIEDADQDDIGVTNEIAYLLGKASDVIGIARGIEVVMGNATALGDGFDDLGDVFVDLGDAWDMSGTTTYYVTEVRSFGDDGLIKQIFLSRDNP